MVSVKIVIPMKIGVLIKEILLFHSKFTNFKKKFKIFKMRKNISILINI